MTTEERSKERAEAQRAALDHELEGYEAKVAGAKKRGDAVAEGMYKSRIADVKAAMKDADKEAKDRKPASKQEAADEAAAAKAAEDEAA